MTHSGQDRIAILSHSHPSLSKGGSEVAAYNLFKGLQAMGRDAVFIAACPYERKGELYLDGSREYALFFDQTSYSHLYQRCDPASADALLRLMTSLDCRIANFHHYLHFGVNSLRKVVASGIRTFITLHEYLALCHHYGQMVTRPDFQLCTRAAPAKCHRCFPDVTPQQFERRRHLFQEVFADVERFVSPSHFLARRYEQWGLAADRISVIENGLDHAEASPPAPATRDPGRPWTFGYFGQINPFKGIDVLLSVAEMLEEEAGGPPIVIRAHGNMVGQSESFLARFQKACQGRVFDYFGPYDNEEVSMLMGQCDYVVTPSLWWENSPVVIQEAFAAGRPVVASGVGGLAEKVSDGRSGLHFRIGSAPDLKRAMLAATDPGLAGTLRSGLPTPPSKEDMARSYLELFEPGPQPR